MGTKGRAQSGTSLKRPLIYKLFGAAVAVGVLLWLDLHVVHLTPETLRTWMLSFGWLAPVIYIGLFVARPFTLFPASVLSLAGGLAFGTGWGIVYTTLGELPGAILSYLLARKLGGGLFRGLESDPRLQKLERAMARRGFPIVLTLRLAPFVPFDLVSYAAGLAKVPLRAYAIATFLGALPGTFAYTFLGASLTHGGWKQIALAAAVLLVALAVPLLFRSKVEKQVDGQGTQ
ncbi:TVP38/TMEM64 family protein [Cohnella fermenti]|uniref:TVP38/TMEM64 family membrane protein n=1 Tax=Cohnella fermenti TaxID=2565925 RepID=A0A4S4BNA3_9BACL|nr:TVP38/TMEM64 family protein [Cohnella fermenti]THF73983.1 TVP38/TMEM64 family protein [Cohnella fermenti]